MKKDGFVFRMLHLSESRRFFLFVWSVVLSVPMLLIFAYVFNSHVVTVDMFGNTYVMSWGGTFAVCVLVVAFVSFMLYVSIGVDSAEDGSL